jgi:hypothetical protein
MRNPAALRRGERGQTLPVWALAVLTSLSLIFFSLNYANTLHWQIRAQNAADAAATANLAFQSLEFNKTTALLYAADVEEWRMRHLIHAMLDDAQFHYIAPNTYGGNGGCSFPVTSGLGGTAGTCYPIYTALRVQYLKAVARYTNDIQMLQGIASVTLAQRAYDVQWNVHLSGTNCGYAVDCSFSYYMIDYSSRTPAQGVGKDAGYVQMGGMGQASTPNPIWYPARIEIATCKTVQPIVHFNLFGLSPQPFTVIGRAAATNVPVNEEWLAPGVDVSAALGAPFQTLEDYDPTDDNFPASTWSPRPWYDTTYQAQPYNANPSQPSIPYTFSSFTDDFEVLASWWAAIPIAPYTTTAFSKSTLCSQEPAP